MFRSACFLTAMFPCVLAAEPVASIADAVEKCWVSATIPFEAADGRILVSYLAGREGFPRINTIRMEAAEPTRAVGSLIFPSARRAIIRCTSLIPKKERHAPVLLMFSVKDGVAEVP